MENRVTLDYVLDLKEWSRFECKRPEVKPLKLLETACAFLNSEGGLIAIGVEDPNKAARSNRVIGISQYASQLSEVHNLITKEFEPPLIEGIILTEIEVINRHGAADKIILLKVPKGRDIHSLKKGDTFVRKGSSNFKIGATEITRLRFEKGSLKYEEELARTVTLDDLDTNLLQQYKRDNDSLEDNDWNFLRDNGLAQRIQGEDVLTMAGVLLFANNPVITLKSKCSIKVSHYYGQKRDYSGQPNFARRPLTLEGPLLHQIQQALAHYQEKVEESPPKLIGAKFLPTLLIPEWAFQEAVVNAVVHRNYSIQDDIQIRFFDDRIEVESPGGYPGHINLQNIRSERFARNPIIQRTLNRFRDNPNLDVGEGVERIFRVMKDQNLYEPVYSSPADKPNAVLLKLYNVRGIDYWDTVRNYLGDHHKINNRTVRQITGLADSSKVSRMLKAWIKQGLIDKVENGYRGNTYYKLTGSDWFV